MTYRSAAVSALGALGDSTRRTIFERLAEKPAAVGEIAQGLPVSRPAVSQHLKVLKAAGLVTESAEGTRHIYRIDPRGIGAVRQWLDQFHGQALDAFKAYAEAQERAAPQEQEPE
jgi:DNA-binding transcriptional ArsR family regulator